MLAIFIVVVISSLIYKTDADSKTDQSCNQVEALISNTTHVEPLISNTTHDCYELRNHR